MFFFARSELTEDIKKRTVITVRGLSTFISFSIGRQIASRHPESIFVITLSIGIVFLNGKSEDRYGGQFVVGLAHSSEQLLPNQMWCYFDILPKRKFVESRIAVNIDYIY